MVLPEKARLMVVASSRAPSSASLYPATPRASGVAMNRVPIHTPSAPRARAAARPRPSKIPPAATTGMLSPTASTIWGTSGMVDTVPVWPPASLPWATTTSHPASRARRAWSTLPHMLTTRTPWRVAQSSTTSAGTPSPATKTLAPPSTTCSTWATRSPGIAVSRSTPNGRSVAARTAAISSTIVFGAHGGCAQASEAPGVRHGGDKGRVRDAAHAGQHHRMLHPQDLGEPRLHATSSYAPARHPARRP